MYKWVFVGNSDILSKLRVQLDITLYHLDDLNDGADRYGHDMPWAHLNTGKCVKI